ncbi:MAG: DUF134 domain-containing protein [Bacteroidota bacterium]
MSPRSKQFRKVVSPPVLKGFQPIGVPFNDAVVVSLLCEEYEALRLADYSGMKQEEAARMMNVSRPTFTRIYSSCLQKIARAFTEGRSIIIEGGDVEFDKQWYRCHECTTVFHHPNAEHQECINCKSENIEHINKSIRDWKEEQTTAKPVLHFDEFCICPRCNYEMPHEPGVPCFSQTCPICKTSLIRKRD